MNGVHDLGGMDGFGPVDVEAGEPVFHAPWERRVFGMAAAIAAAKLSNTHRFRHAIERMEPAHYLQSPYYEHWLTALGTLLAEQGLVTREELAAAAGGAFPLSQPDRGNPDAPAVESDVPRFAVGAAVRVRNRHPLGHTRCPRYVRGHVGVIARVDRRFVVPDLAAHADRAGREFTYSVRFTAAELWGNTAHPADSVHVDLWERYLEAP